MNQAIADAIARFPSTFQLRGHEGTFRISERSSYMSRETVMLYTQRLWTSEEFKGYYGRAPHSADDLWIDFAKGTESELRAQIKR